MPKSITEYREDVLAGKQSVGCGFKIGGCEGTMPFHLAWHVVVNLEAVFPNGFSLNQLNAAQLEEAELTCCDSCKKQLEQAAAETKRLKPTFVLFKDTVDQLANGRLQQAVADERAEAERRRKQARACLDRLPIGNGHGHSKAHKPSARDVARNNGHHAPVATTA